MNHFVGIPLPKLLNWVLIVRQRVQCQVKRELGLKLRNHERGVDGLVYVCVCVCEYSIFYEVGFVMNKAIKSLLL